MFKLHCHLIGGPFEMVNRRKRFSEKYIDCMRCKLTLIERKLVQRNLFREFLTTEKSILLYPPAQKRTQFTL